MATDLAVGGGGGGGGGALDTDSLLWWLQNCLYRDALMKQFITLMINCSHYSTIECMWLYSEGQ